MTIADCINDVFNGTHYSVYRSAEFVAAGRRYTVRYAFVQDPDDGSLLPIIGDVIPHWVDLDTFDRIVDGDLAANCLARDWGRENNMTIAEARIAIMQKVRDEGDDLVVNETKPAQ